MPRLTLGDLATSLDWGRLANLCPRLGDGSIDPRVTMLANRSEERMMARGDWIGTMQLVRFCIYESCITFPRQVERVEEAMLNGNPLEVKNQWASFVDPIGSRYGNGWFGGWGPFTFNYAGGGLGGCSNNGRLIDRGEHATFRDIIPGTKKIRIYPDSPNDVGKEVLIQGYDDSNQFIIESPDYNGFKLTLALPYVESSYFVSSIVGVTKPITDRNLNLYEVATSTANSLRLLAIYEPGETTVSLRRYQIPGFPCTSTCAQNFLALVKLQHVPVLRETDYLVIQSPAAFEEMIRALEKKDAGQYDEAARSEADCVRELNLGKRNHSPSDQMPIVIRTQGNSQPRRYGVGYIR